MLISSRPLHCAALAAAVLVLVGSGPAGATPTYLASVSASCNAPTTTRSNAIPADAISCGNATLSASGWTSAGAGFIRAEATASLSFGGSATTVSAYGQGVSQMQDSFVVSALDGAGSPIASGFLTAIVQVEAVAEVTVDGGFASILWNLDVGGVGRNGRALATRPFGNSTSTSGGTYLLQVPWSAGSPVGITFFANAEALVAEQAAGTYTALADFASSMHWMGIQGVTDGAGTPAASFTALSPDGFDYVAAVPEPAPLALLALGLAGLVALPHRRPRPR